MKKRIAESAVIAAITCGPMAMAQQQGGVDARGQQLAQEAAAAPGSPIYISTAGVRQIQQALNQRGYDVGKVDGLWNKQTGAAARNFQRSQGLEPTGTLTLGLIHSLGMGDVLAGQTGGGPGGQWAQERARGPGTPLYLSTASVRQIQQALNRLGYDAGNVDGQWSQATRRAAANFQQAQGLDPIGRPDVNLITGLGLGQTILADQAKEAASTGDMQWRQETAVGPGTQLWASPATVREIQQALSEVGFDVNDVDGQWGEQTTNAVQRYQRARGMEPTGTLTTTLMASLGMDDWLVEGAAVTGGGAQAGQAQGGTGRQGRTQSSGGQMNKGGQGQSQGGR